MSGRNDGQKGSGVWNALGRTLVRDPAAQLFEALIIAALLISSVGIASAQIAPSGGPSSPNTQMPTLTQIYDQVDTGAESAVQSGFVGPSGGPTTTTMQSLNDIMGILPEADPTNCAITDDVLAPQTFWGLCSGAGWGLLTGTGSGGAAATGQNVCYNAAGSVISCTGTGQDGEYQLGATASPRFTDNSDGTVTDNLTSLIWLKNANCTATLGGVAKTTTLIWADSLTWSNNMASGSCGLTDSSAAGDWRLPNVRELASLVDYQTNPAPTLPTGHPFTGVVSGYYWSSTSVVLSPSSAWDVTFANGSIVDYSKPDSDYVWPVR